MLLAGSGDQIGLDGWTATSSAGGASHPCSLA